MNQQENKIIWIVGIIAVVLVSVLGLCCFGWQIVKVARESITPKITAELPAKKVELVIAYSPEKEAIFTKLVAQFNNQIADLSTDVLSINAVRHEPDLMIEAALRREVQAISPDSSVWLDTLDREWASQTGLESPLVGQTERYAVSPIVIAMWQDVARDMGYPDKALGWQDVLDRAQSDPSFKWSHPSTNSAAGLLATLAMFYAGADKSRGLTQADVQAQSTLDYVAAVEKTVRHYGEGELTVIQQAAQEGRAYLDAFVCQEQLVVQHNIQHPDQPLVAIYPIEGTLWEDHPLALLETETLTDAQRVTFSRFVEFIKARASQNMILQAGYRPTDLGISLSSELSPLTNAHGVDSTQPKTSLQMPSPSVIDVVRDVWWYTKRHTNVYLVVDVSGSMEGPKLANTQEALDTFMLQIKGDMERVGLVLFSTDVIQAVPLEELEQNRTDISSKIDELEAAGSTALLDAVDLAFSQLQNLDDADRINAIVVMTDGIENRSRVGLGTLVDRIKQGNEQGVPVIIFCIGYGSDADERVLRTLSEASGGQYYTGDLETIRRLYKILSTYF